MHNEYNRAMTRLGFVKLNGLQYPENSFVVLSLITWQKVINIMIFNKRVSENHNKS